MKCIYLLFTLSLAFQYAHCQTNETTPPSNGVNDSTTDTMLTPDSQEVSEKDLINLIDEMPVFGIYLDNYFISGVPLNKDITQETADAKYQISFRHRITKTILPFNTALLLTYTQKSFWNIYEKSLPFKDSNFNPGLALAKPVSFEDRLWGITSLAVEHESNGRDSIYSRSWNYLTGSVTYFHNNSLSFNAKAWIGFLAEENEDLFNYKGYGFVAANFRTKNDKIRLTATINPRRIGKFNTIMEVNYKPISSLNQYLFLQWYQGYAENLLDYNMRTSMLRIGFSIKPDFKNFH